MSGFGAGAGTMFVLILGLTLTLLSMFVSDPEHGNDQSAAFRIALGAFVVTALGGYMLGFWVGAGTWTP